MVNNFLVDKKPYQALDSKKTYDDLCSFFDIPNLVSIQRKSFYDFLENGLIEACNKNNPIIFSTNNQKLELIFFPNWIQFRKPELEIRDTTKLGKTYGSSVYLPVLLKSRGAADAQNKVLAATSWKKSKLEWLLLGFLPFMTPQGHFLINGIPRVVLHQMVRNPGIYTIPKDSRTKVPTIRIVPEQGSWINITLDKKNRIWITTRILRRKVSALIFLQALGFSLSEIYKRIEHSEILQASFVKPLKTEEKTRHDTILIRANLNGHPMSQNEACRYLYAHFQEYTSQAREQLITNQNAREFFWKIVWNPKNRHLGKIGRQQFFEKLASGLPKTAFDLTGDDMLVATEALIKLLFGERLADDIDSLINKRIRGCGDFLEDELIRGFREFELILSRKFSNTTYDDLKNFWKFNRSTLAKCVSKAWKSFFTSGTLSQFMDETNPLSEITHKRRVTVLGPGGVNSKQTTIQIRGIHATYYGRLCPIETPEGQNAGLVNSFTVYTKRDRFGNLKTPFYQVYKGQVQSKVNLIFSIPQQESHEILAPADLQVSNLNMFPKTRIPIRKDWKFDYGKPGEITTQSVGVLQMISVATSLIPFLEHDDANRALMGSNMQRQAVPLLKPQVAIVHTGLESRVISDVNHILQSPKSGYITAVSSTSIQIYKPRNLVFQASTFLTKNFLQPFAKNVVFDTALSQTVPKIEFLALFENQQILSNRALNFTFSLQKLTLSFGLDGAKKNVISTKYKKIFRFSRKKNFKTKYLNYFPTNPNCLPLFSSLQNSPTVTGSSLHQKDFFGNRSATLENPFLLDVYQRTNQSTCIYQYPVIKEKNWVQKGELLADGGASSRGKLALGKNVLVAYLPWEGYNFEDAILISEKLVTNDIFTSLHIDYYEVEVKNTQYGLEKITNQIPIEVDDPAKDILRIQRLNSQGLIKIGSWVEEGDYLVGKVSPVGPKGPSVQQQYEKLYNVIMQRDNNNLRNTSLRVPKAVQGFVLDVQLLPPKEADVVALAPKNSILRVRISLLQKRKIQVGDKMAGRHGNKGVISKILPVYDMPYLPDGTPIDIVLNPLGVPSRMNVGQILESLLGLAGFYLNESYTINLFDEKFGAEASRSFVYSKLYQASIKTQKSWLFEPQHPGKVQLFDGRTGECFDQAITVGCTYMLKLVHLVDDKIHARATGPYSAVTQQPVRGRSRNGGQRLGEMEVWALQAYGAAFTLQELLTIKSDDVDGRKEAVFRIYTNKSLTYGQPESFKVLLRELQALCFDLKLYSMDFQTSQIKSINLKVLEKLN
jgi:DNA-directed RNA polymerase beta subunit